MTFCPCTAHNLNTYACTYINSPHHLHGNWIIYMSTFGYDLTLDIYMNSSCICELPIAHETLKIEPLYGVTQPGRSVLIKST